MYIEEVNRYQTYHHSLSVLIDQIVYEVNIVECLIVNNVPLNKLCKILILEV